MVQGQRLTRGAAAPDSGAPFVQGVGFKVEDLALGPRVQGSGLRVKVAGFGAQGLALRRTVYSSGLGFRVEVLRFRVESLGFRVQGLGFRV